MAKRTKVKRLLTFKDVLAGEKIAWDILKDLEFSDDIDGQMQDVVEGFMLSGVLEARAEERYDRQRIELDEFRGQLDSQAREELPKVTDSSVRAFIESDEEYVKRRKRVTKFNRQAKILKHLNRAFQIKAELIRTKAATLRKQYDDLGMNPPTVGKKKKRRK